MVMVAQTTWHELYRCEDLLGARAVATSIAAMEFDARLCACGDHRTEQPLFVIEVRLADWADLADVLPEIIDEQQEFDRRLEQRCCQPDRQRMLAIVTLTSIVEILAIFGLIKL